MILGVLSSYSRCLTPKPCSLTYVKENNERGLTMFQDAAGASCACRCRMRKRQGCNFTSGSFAVRTHGAPLAAIPFSPLWCNELHRYALHDAHSTVSLLHMRGMFAHHFACLLRSWWQVLGAQ